MPLFDHVMLIDDSNLANLITRKMLEIHKVADQISLFTGAEDALTYLQDQNGALASGHEQLILLDIHMPGTDGFGFLDAFGKMDEGMRVPWKIYMLSSSISPDDIERAEEHPLVEGYIMKPLTANFFNQFKEISS